MAAGAFLSPAARPARRGVPAWSGRGRTRFGFHGDNAAAERDPLTDALRREMRNA